MTVLSQAPNAEQLLEQHFDTAFAAPDGLKKLRELILMLAMQGKLVAQDPSDPPASELLRDIEQEKRRLVVAGQIKAPKPLPPIEADEVPYEVPQGWAWVRLGDVADYNGRDVAKLSDIDPNTWLLDLEDIEKETSRLIYRASFGERESKSNKNAFKKGDVLYGKLRPYLVKVIVADDDGICTTEIAPIVPNRALDSVYLLWLLKRHDFLNYVNQLMYGVKMPRLGTEQAVLSLHPLPPLPEQRRIVARIEQLMARCDELEALRNAQQQKRLDVHTAALSDLLGAATPQAFAQAWQFVARHFGDLYGAPHNVAELRKAVLQLAVMGKLVPQDPTDPPARELLREIEAEKRRLVAAGKIKAPKPLPPVKPEDRPYEVPQGWEWVRLGNLVSLLGDGIHGTPVYDATGEYYFINGNNLVNGSISIKENTKKVSRLEFEKHRKSLNSQSVFVSINGTIGNVAFYDNEKIILGKSACYFNLLDPLDKFYTRKVLLSNYFLNYALSSATGTTIKNVSLGAMRDFPFPFPLPPLPEQRRIVAKIDELMRLCDDLSAQLSAQSATQSALLGSLMAAVTPASPAPERRPTPGRSAVLAEPAAPAASTEPKQRGRPAKAGGIPTATSEADAIRQLNELKFQRAEGTRQEGLFD